MQFSFEADFDSQNDVELIYLSMIIFIFFTQFFVILFFFVVFTIVVTTLLYMYEYLHVVLVLYSTRRFKKIVTSYKMHAQCTRV